MIIDPVLQKRQQTQTSPFKVQVHHIYPQKTKPSGIMKHSTDVSEGIVCVGDAKLMING